MISKEFRYCHELTHLLLWKIASEILLFDCILYFFQFGENNIKKTEFKAHGLKPTIHLSFIALYLISTEGNYECKI